MVHDDLLPAVVAFNIIPPVQTNVVPGLDGTKCNVVLNHGSFTVFEYGRIYSCVVALGDSSPPSSVPKSFVTRIANYRVVCDGIASVDEYELVDEYEINGDLMGWVKRIFDH
jgi:hypothetical protein